MKKSSRKRHATPKRAATKRDNPPEFDQANDPPEVKQFMHEIGQTYRQPSHFELAQIAALLCGNNYRAGLTPRHLTGVSEDESKLFVTDAALGLWERCGQTQRERLQQEANREEYAKTPDFFKSVWALAEGFPLRFDSGVKFIVGKEMGRGYRHKRFHAFLRATIPGPKAKEEERDSIAANRISELKKDGFSQQCFEEMKQLFNRWEANQAKEKASAAVRKRWETSTT